MASLWTFLGVEFSAGLGQKNISEYPLPIFKNKYNKEVSPIMTRMSLMHLCFRRQFCPVRPSLVSDSAIPPILVPFVLFDRTVAADPQVHAYFRKATYATARDSQFSAPRATRHNFASFVFTFNQLETDRCGSPKIRPAIAELTGNNPRWRNAIGVV